MVIEILTDNLNRAAMSVRSAVSKSGGKMADPGSVLFNFSRQGCVVLSGGAEDAVFAAATEAGAEDVLPRPGGEAGWEVTCAVADYGPVAAALKAAGLPMVGDLSGLRLVPLARVDVVRASPCFAVSTPRADRTRHAARSLMTRRLRRMRRWWTSCLSWMTSTQSCPTKTTRSECKRAVEAGDTHV